MEYLIGVMVGFGVSVLGILVGFERDRSFYPTVLIVVAAYYSLFATMGASSDIIIAEVAAGGLFLMAAVIGFKRNMWVVAAAIAGHGAFDMVHHLLIEDPGVPLWWPGFCAAADVVLGGWLGMRLWKMRGNGTAAPGLKKI